VDKNFASRNLYIGYFFGELVISDHYRFAKCLILFVKSTPHPSKKNILFEKFFSKKRPMSPPALNVPLPRSLLVCSASHVCLNAVLA